MRMTVFPLPIVVAIVRIGDLLADLEKPEVWIEVSQQVVTFLDDGAEVIAKTGVDREVGSDAPVVLSEQADGGNANVALGIALEETSDRRSAGNEVLEWSAWDGHAGCWINPPEAVHVHAASRESVRFAAFETETAFAVAVANIFGGTVAEFAAKFPAMFATGVRNVVTYLIGAIGSGEERPAVIAAERIETGDGDLGKTEVDGGVDAGVEAVGGGRHVGVHGQDGLIEIVEADFHFVYEMVGDGVGPVETGDLYAGFGLRLPDGLKNGNVALGLKAVADEIACAESLFVVDVIVGFHQAVVFAVFVRETELKDSGSGGVGWEIFEQT